MGPLTRRRFIKLAASACAPSIVLGLAAPAAAATPITARLRGFNLLNRFLPERTSPFNEADFEMIAGWGFNFVRLPIQWEVWTDASGEPRDTTLRDADQAIAFGRRYGIHVNLALSSGPGFCHCVGKGADPLWSSGTGPEQPLAQLAGFWRTLTSHYTEVPPAALSFNILGEPNRVGATDYDRIIRYTISAIRAVDQNRPVVVDGLDWARSPLPDLAGPGVTESRHGYDPFHLTHYRAPWVPGSDRWPPPSWPMELDGVRWDKDRLRQETITPWEPIRQRGAGLQAGEWGVYRETPEQVTLAWMADQLALWREAEWSWALWQLYGDFGVLDSRRADVKYDKYNGHDLHRAMLELLQAS